MKKGQAYCAINGSLRWKVSVRARVETTPEGDVSLREECRVFFVYAATEEKAIRAFRAGASASLAGVALWVSPDVEPWKTRLDEGVYNPETRAR